MTAKKAAKKSAPIWIRGGAWKDKRNARCEAKALRAPGEGRVRARIVKEVWWRVEFADLENENDR